jgi:hypothetical protein
MVYNSRRYYFFFTLCSLVVRGLDDGQSFGNWICFRPQMRERHLLYLVPWKELTSKLTPVS